MQMTHGANGGVRDAAPFTPLQRPTHYLHFEFCVLNFAF
jgi:hypothetical protein